MSINASAVTYTEFNSDFSKILKLTQWEINPEVLGANEILLESLASPVNPADLAQLRGNYPSKPTEYSNLGTKGPVYVGGNEGIFRVTRVGSSVTKFVPGDWLIPLLPSFGTWRTHVVADLTKLDPLIKISSDDDPLLLELAATISINPATAYQLLFQFVPEWKSDGTEFVIQNAGNSQVAKYVSQIAKHYKINTISVVRDGKSQGEIDELYSLGATKVISELELSDPNFATHTLRDIIGDGTVRLALNSVGGSTIPHFVKALSQNGVLATFGAISGSDISYSSVDQLFKNITTVAFWLSASTRKDPDFKIKTINDLVDLYKNEQISTPKFNHVHVDNPDALLTDLMTSISNSKNGKQVLIYKKEF